MSKAYEGNEPYIFVSYAHKDKVKVMRYIDALKNSGFRVWYDQNLHSGSDWSNVIASQLDGCACFLAFLSKNFDQSEHCNNELKTAQDLNKVRICACIEEFTFSAGLDFQLKSIQYMKRYDYFSDEEFFAALSEDLKLALAGSASLGSAGTVDQREVRYSGSAQNVRTNAGNFDPSSYFLKKSKQLGWSAVILELVGICISIGALGYMSMRSYSGFYMFMGMNGIRFIVICLNLLIFLIYRRDMKDYADRKRLIGKAQDYLLAVSGIGSLVAIFGGAANLYIEAGFMIRLFASFGLNLLPSFSALYLYGCYTNE